MSLTYRSKQTYPLADRPTQKELKELGCNKRLSDDTMYSASDVKAIPTGQFRFPRKGEWYLSGAIIEAYKAETDLDYEFHIAKLVRTKKITVEIVLDT